MGLEHTKPETMFDLQRGYGKHMEMPFHSQQEADVLFGTGAQLHDPSAHDTGSRPATAPTVRAPRGAQPLTSPST